MQKKYEEISNKLYIVEGATNKEKECFTDFIMYVIEKCCDFYHKNKIDKIYYKTGVSFIESVFEEEFRGCFFNFNVKIWNFKEKSFISEENQMYLNSPTINFSDIFNKKISCDFDLVLISGNSQKEIINRLLNAFKNEYRKKIINTFKSNFSKEEQKQYYLFLSEYCNLNSNRCKITVNEEENSDMLNFILTFEGKKQLILISLWILAMNECASSFKTCEKPYDFSHIYYNIIFTYDEADIDFGFYEHRNGSTTHVDYFGDFDELLNSYSETQVYLHPLLT